MDLAWQPPGTSAHIEAKGGAKRKRDVERISQCC